MEPHALLDSLKQTLPMEHIGLGLGIAGSLALLYYLAPKLLALGVPIAIRAADIIAGALMRSPLKPVLLWKVKEIVALLDSLSDAVGKIVEAFTNRLETDLKEAAGIETANKAVAEKEAASKAAGTDVPPKA